MLRSPAARPQLAPLDDFLYCLRCPVCSGELVRDEHSLVCGQGHTANIAKQGYATLLGPGGGTHTADSKTMLAARFRVLAGGLFDPLSVAISRAIRSSPLDSVSGPVLDLGTGTGYHLEAALEELPDRLGIGFDNSKFAARMAARCHPRAAGAVVDIWEQLPLRDSSVSVLLDVFAPRNGDEMARVLGSGGIAVTVTPGPDHLGELIERFGMITVDPDKDDRLERQMAPVGPVVHSESVEWGMELFRSEVSDIVAMGPSSERLGPEELEEALSELPDKTAVTGSVNLNLWIAEE